MASLITGQEGAAKRWGSFVEKAVAGSVHAVELPFVDAGLKTGSLSGAGFDAAGIGKVALRGKGAASGSTDESRVSREGKQGRLVRIAPVAPPKAFSAGSILERTSALMRPTLDGEVVMAFAEPAIQGREIAIATAFHAKEEPKPDLSIPPQLAALVNNDKADVLATAYAPPQPDYAKASPFETLLKLDPENDGRFIPPVADGDHDWMSHPLPPVVFTPKEQACLATAIYFEARGENLRGQAAVAQVILNRVRNPAYPDTICGVVYQNSSWKNACQFSFACDGVKDRILSPTNYRTAEQVALAVTAGKIFIPEVGSSTHYYADYVSPSWARDMERKEKIGRHIFFRTYGGGWN